MVLSADSGMVNGGNLVLVVVLLLTLNGVLGYQTGCNTALRFFNARDRSYLLKKDTAISALSGSASPPTSKKIQIVSALDSYLKDNEVSYSSLVESIDAICGSHTSTATSVSANARLYFMASQEDDTKESTNINDKIWSTALKYGDVTTGINEADGTFDIMMKFAPFFVLQYVYRFKSDVSMSNVQYLDFQWLLFGKKVYNRLINRNERWDSKYEDEQLSLFHVTNSDACDDQYSRLLLFQR